MRSSRSPERAYGENTCRDWNGTATPHEMVTRARLWPKSMPGFWRPVCFAVIALIIGSALAFEDRIRESMLQPLVVSRHLPEAVSAGGAVVYLLGGTTDSLLSKFRTSSRLVHDGKVERVLVQSQVVLMAFVPSLNRNLTANEWVVEKLGALGVPAEKIEFLAFQEGYFGTWSEAKALARLAREQGIRNLVLVTSPFHSRRVLESFSRTVERPGMRLFLYHCDETASIRLLVLEYIKLLFYRAVLF